MAKDLTVSSVDRQNILNNPYALEEIQKSIGLKGFIFNGKLVFLKEQVVAFFEVTSRTIELYLAQHEVELHQNGYAVLRGKSLQEFKLALTKLDVTEINFGNIPKTPQLGIFDFKAFLNLAMLITESEKARILRQVILDIVIDTINTRTGGGTKYVNQRDEDFIISCFEEENYRQQFTRALNYCVEMGTAKYPVYTNKIYVSIFKENAQEYRKILRLHEKDKVRDKITHLFFCANKFHCFQDGNKRIALSLSAQFLLLNGYMYCTGKFIREMENISYHLAAGKIEKDLLHDIIFSIINEALDDNEELKLRIINVIQEQS